MNNTSKEDYSTSCLKLYRSRSKSSSPTWTVYSTIYLLKDSITHLLKLTSLNQNKIFIYLRGVKVLGGIHWSICHVESLSKDNKRNPPSLEMFLGFIAARKLELDLTSTNDTKVTPYTNQSRKTFGILTFVQ